jgi:23S rRNA pseudouridine1911/1915/1917 synthase
MDGQRVELHVEEGGIRLDKFLAGQLGQVTRSAVQRLVDEGRVTVNGELIRASYKVRRGDEIAVRLPAPEPVQPAPEAIALDVVYEDDALLIVNKAAGMVVHPAPGHSGGTLVNAVLAHSPEIAVDAEDGRPGIVHRLDRDTSGLILVAKSEPVRRALQRQFQARQVTKVYLALVEGRLEPRRGRIEAPIGRDPKHRQRMAVLPQGRQAITDYRVVSYFEQEMGDLAGEYTLIEAEPKTGRTHQIRVHLASIGHPVAGDGVYGRRHRHLPVPRMFLHAERLVFSHPITGERVEVQAPLPDDLAAVLKALGG